MRGKIIILIMTIPLLGLCAIFFYVKGFHFAYVAPLLSIVGWMLFRYFKEVTIGNKHFEENFEERKVCPHSMNMSIKSSPHKMEGWSDYWSLFNQLINLLLANNKEEIVSELREAQLYVNGLTDGWHDFKDAFEKIVNDYRNEFTSEQYDLAEYLLKAIKLSLLCR